MFLEWNNQYCEKNYTIKVQLLSHLWLFWTPWTAACQASLSITNSWSLLKLISFKSVMPSNHLIPCHLLLVASVFLSIRIFVHESVFRIRWLSIGVSASASNEYSGLITFRMDWFDIPAVQGTLKSLFQHHSSKASVLQHSPFFKSNSHIHNDYWKNHSFD